MGEVIEEVAKKLGTDVAGVEEQLKKRQPLLIQSWGKAHRDSPPAGCEANFNACVLNARGGEADASTMNGTYEEMQRKLIQGSLFVTWMVQAVEKIERLDCHCIGV